MRDYINVYDITDELATGRNQLDRLVMPNNETPDYSYEIQARHSMIDHTGHVNNSEYIKWIFDALSQIGFNADKPFSLELNFQHETKPDDTAVVSVYKKDDAIFSNIINSVGTSVIACLKYL